MYVTLHLSPVFISRLTDTTGVVVLYRKTLTHTKYIGTESVVYLVSSHHTVHSTRHFRQYQRPQCLYSQVHITPYYTSECIEQCNISMDTTTGKQDLLYSCVDWASPQRQKERESTFRCILESVRVWVFVHLWLLCIYELVNEHHEGISIHHCLFT